MVLCYFGGSVGTSLALVLLSSFKNICDSSLLLVFARSLFGFTPILVLLLQSHCGYK